MELRIEFSVELSYTDFALANTKLDNYSYSYIIAGENGMLDEENTRFLFFFSHFNSTCISTAIRIEYSWNGYTLLSSQPFVCLFVNMIAFHDQKCLQQKHSD